MKVERNELTLSAGITSVPPSRYERFCTRMRVRVRPNSSRVTTVVEPAGRGRLSTTPLLLTRFTRGAASTAETAQNATAAVRATVQTLAITRMFVLAFKPKHFKHL